MTTDLTNVARQFTGVDRTGGALTLDAEHRTSYVAGLATSPVTVLAGSPSLELAVVGAHPEAHVVADVAALFALDDDLEGTVVAEAPAAVDRALVDELVRRAGQGTAVILVAERALGGERSAAELLVAESGAGTVVRHAPANASVFAFDGAAPDATIQARLIGNTPVRQVATHDVAVVGVDATTAAATEIGLAVVDPELLEELVTMNEALRRENVRLAQARLGVHDAAAGRASAANTEASRLRAEVGTLQLELDKALESARVNDELFQEARLLLYQAMDREKRLEIQVAHQTVHPKLIAKTVLAKVRNRLSPRA